MWPLWPYHSKFASYGPAYTTSLSQGRFTWRHDSVLSLLVNRFAAKVPEDVRIYADLPGLKACNNTPGTIPEEFLVTSARPDIVVARGNTIHLLELTVSFNSSESLKNAQSRKNAKVNYQLVLSECDHKGGIKSPLTSIEIGALGHSLTSTLKAVRKVLWNCQGLKLNTSSMMLANLLVTDFFVRRRRGIGFHTAHF